MTDIHKDYTNSNIALLSGLWEIFQEEEYPHRKMWRMRKDGEGGAVFDGPPDYCNDHDALCRVIYEQLDSSEKMFFVRQFCKRFGIEWYRPEIIAIELLVAPTKMKAEILHFVLLQRGPK